MYGWSFIGESTLKRWGHSVAAGRAKNSSSLGSVETKAGLFC